MNRIHTLLWAAVLLLPATASAQLVQLIQLRQIQAIPASPTETDLVFKVDAFNNDTNPAIGVVASARTTTYDSIVLSQPVLVFPDFAPFGNQTSINTVTIRQQNAVRFDPRVVRLFFETTPQGCRIGNAVCGSS